MGEHLEALIQFNRVLGIKYIKRNFKDRGGEKIVCKPILKGDRDSGSTLQIMDHKPINYNTSSILIFKKKSGKQFTLPLIILKLLLRFNI